MRKITFYLVLIFAGMLTFTACDKDEDNDPVNNGNCFIANYGVWGGAKGTISRYDVLTDTVSNSYFKTTNRVDLSSNINYIYEFGNKIYLIGNTSDQIINVDKTTLKQETSGITQDIANPRYCVGKGDYLYISCLGTTLDYKEMLESYIAKYNINTNTVEEMISIPGGTEGLEIVNDKLYVALNYKNNVAVVNLSDNSVSYIATPAVTSYFAKDNNDNLYVSLISTYSNFSTNTGIGYINTTTNELENTYALENVSSSYGSIMKMNNDFSKLYVITGAWDVLGSVAVFDADKKEFATEKFAKEISGLNGISINPENDEVYIFISETVTASGLMKVYLPNGSLKSTHKVGADPKLALFVD